LPHAWQWVSQNLHLGDLTDQAAGAVKTAVKWSTEDGAKNIGGKVANLLTGHDVQSIPDAGRKAIETLLNAKDSIIANNAAAKTALEEVLFKHNVEDIAQNFDIAGKVGVGGFLATKLAQWGLIKGKKQVADGITNTVVENVIDRGGLNVVSQAPTIQDALRRKLQNFLLPPEIAELAQKTSVTNLAKNGNLKIS
jgi:hypothetical protein